MAEAATDADRRTDEAEGAGGGESTLTVAVAFFANLGIAIAKSVVSVITGSASMLAEAAHSWADTGNQVFLFLADRTSRRAPDASHPLGYGRDAYVWSMFAAMGLFVAGGAVSVWHGVSQLTGESKETSYTWAYVVLAVSFLFEGVSFLQAFRQTRREARRVDRDILRHARDTSDPALRAVFAEDSAALTGLVIAATGIFLHQVTGSEVWDAAGSILVGVLLLAVAVVLIQRNRSFLTGQEVDERLRDAAHRDLLALPEVARLTYLWMEYVGPRQVLVVARVGLTGDRPASKAGEALRKLEQHLESEAHVVQAVLTLATTDEPTI